VEKLEAATEKVVQRRSKMGIGVSTEEVDESVLLIQSLCPMNIWLRSKRK
jgi:hypothetical protein